MNALRQLMQIVLDNLRSHFRDGQLVFWNYAFFLLLLVAFVGGIGQDAAVRVVLVCGIVTIATMATALFTVGVGMSAARDRGVYRRLSMYPVPVSRFLLAAVLSRWVVTLTSASLLVLVSRFAFGVPWPGGLLTWLVGLAAGSAAFCSLGFALAGVAHASHRANSYVNLVFVTMLLAGGAALPQGLLPAWLLPASAVLPSTALVDVLQGTMIRGDGTFQVLSPLGVMAAWTILAAVIGVLAWKRRGVM